jgi:hypothetical protein
MGFFMTASKACGKGAVADTDVARMAGANLAFGAPAALQALRDRLEDGALAAVKASNNGLSQEAARWLAGGHRGTSSNAIFTHITGIDATGFGGFDHPHDPADFKRCRLLLEQVPELAPRLQEMKSVSPAWARLVDAWETICATMDTECPDWRGAASRSAPQTYSIIKQAIGR